MRNRAAFLGIIAVTAAIATALGSAMILRSGDSPTASGAPFEPYSVQSDSSSPDKGPAAGATPAAAGGGGANSIVAQSGATTGSVTGSLVNRKIERTSTLAITVDNVLDAVGKIQAAAGSVGGYVSQQNITEQQGPPDDNGNPTKRQLATVQIRVPSESYDSVMSGLRGIAKEVTSENSQTTEVTAQYTDLQSQLRNLQATEKQYLTLLDRAATIDEILTVGDRLGSVRAQIEQIQGQITLLDNLTAMATITVNVTLPPIVVETVTQPTEENFAEEALNNAWAASEDVLQFMGAAAIIAGVAMVWVLVPGVLGLAAWRLLGGKRGHGPAASS